MLFSFYSFVYGFYGVTGRYGKYNDNIKQVTANIYTARLSLCFGRIRLCCGVCPRNGASVCSAGATAAGSLHLLHRLYVRSFCTGHVLVGGLLCAGTPPGWCCHIRVHPHVAQVTAHHGRCVRLAVLRATQGKSHTYK